MIDLLPINSDIVGLAAVLWGFVPIGLSIVAAAVGNRFASLSIWLMGISPLSGTFYGAGTTMPQGDMPIEIKRALPGAFWFWQGAFALIAIWFVLGLIRSRREVAQLSSEEKSPPSSA